MKCTIDTSERNVKRANNLGDERLLLEHQRVQQPGRNCGEKEVFGAECPVRCRPDVEATVESLSTLMNEVGVGR